MICHRGHVKKKGGPALEEMQQMARDARQVQEVQAVVELVRAIESAKPKRVYHLRYA